MTSCPADWLAAPNATPFHHACYLLAKPHTDSWRSSLRGCAEVCRRDFTAVPACFTSEEEVAFVREHLGVSYIWTSYWTGAYRVGDNWTCVDGGEPYDVPVEDYEPPLAQNDIANARCSGLAGERTCPCPWPYA